ncbi:hypothetical protein NP493_219g03015 [Ridgeia piscesae]|uniref:Uncharacterized protein n=1 Tax=Ridgeia piscesae TaxID=27915 RepID=A0AAD9UDY3_RIDPI|nr:hypothetical protein NP493_219g03015 [Ridgeia piscesae]
MGRGKMGPLKKLEKNIRIHKAFMQLGEEWNLKSDLLKQLEEFTCLMYGQIRESSVDGVRAKHLRKIKDWAVFLEDVDRKLAASGIDKPLQVGDPGPGDVSLVDVRRCVRVTLNHYREGAPLELDLQTVTAAVRGARCCPVLPGGARWCPVVAGGGRWWPVVAGGGRWWPVVAGGGRWWPVVAGGGRWWPVVAGRVETTLERLPRCFWTTALAELGARVLLISYNSRYACIVWLEKTMCRLDIATDRDRTFGGDLIVDSDGNIVFLYANKTGSDRPDIATLLDVLRVRDTRPVCKPYGSSRVDEADESDREDCDMST